MPLQFNLAYFFQTLFVGFGVLIALLFYFKKKNDEYGPDAVQTSFGQEDEETPGVVTDQHVLISSECRGADVWHIYMKDFDVVEVLHQKQSPGCLS